MKFLKSAAIAFLCNIVLEDTMKDISGNTNCPRLMMVRLWIFGLYVKMVWMQYTLNRNCTSNFGFWSFPRLVIRGVILSCDAGQWHLAELPSVPRRVGEQWCSTACCVGCWLWFFGYCSLCFPIPSCLQDAHLCLPLLVRRGRERQLLLSWNSR